MYILQDGDHVVAGARGMMRYRRNRASTMEGQQAASAPQQQQQQQQQLLPSQGIGYGVGANTGGSAPWAMYQTNNTSGKPAGSNMPVRSFYN